MPQEEKEDLRSSLRVSQNQSTLSLADTQRYLNSVRSKLSEEGVTVSSLITAW
jgi:hypothetical protein